MKWLRLLGVLVLAGFGVGASEDARGQAPGEFVPSRSGRRFSVFIPPIGRFGGFSGDFGRGGVSVNVGPSGGRFGGVNVDVFRPTPFYGQAVVYGPAPVYAPYGVERYGYGPSSGRSVVVGPGGVFVEGPYGPQVIVVPNPYLGAVGGTGEVQAGPQPYESGELGGSDSEPFQPVPPRQQGPATSPSSPNPSPSSRTLDDLLPAPPESSTKPAPATGGSAPRGPALNGPALNPPAVNGTSGNGAGTNSPAGPSAAVAPRLFPTSGAAFFPPGVIPRNGFDVDRGARPNAPSRPGVDPFGPTPPAVDPAELPAT